MGRGTEPVVRGATAALEAVAPSPAGFHGFDAPTLVGLVLYNAQHFGNRVALREKDYGIWQEYTWADYARHVVEMALGLEAQIGRASCRERGEHQVEGGTGTEKTA